MRVVMGKPANSLPPPLDVENSPRRRSFVITHAKRLTKSKFARSVALVASGTAAAQVITLVFTPIITRLYGPEAFGLLGAFNAILSITLPLAAFSYPIAIVLPKSDLDAKGLVRLSLKVGLLTSSITFFIFLIAGQQLVTLLNMSAAAQLIWFIPIAMLLSVLLATANQWAVRKKLFKLKAKVAVSNALIQNLLKAGIGFFAPFAWVLIAVTTFGQALNAGLFYLGFKKERSSSQVELTEDKSRSQRELAKQHGDFAYFRTPQIVLNAVSQGLPVLMLTALFGPAVAGFYALGKMALAAPAQLLGQSVSTVFYPHFNEALLKGRPGAPLLLKATLSLAGIGLLPFGLVVLFGPWLFAVVFGAEWRVAGEFASWMAVFSFVGFINRPSVAAIPVLRLQGFFLVYEIVSTLLRAGALYIAYVIFGTALSTVIAFSLIGVLLNLFLIIVTFAMSLRGDRRR